MTKPIYCTCILQHIDSVLKPHLLDDLSIQQGVSSALCIGVAFLSASLCYYELKLTDHANLSCVSFALTESTGATGA